MKNYSKEKALVNKIRRTQKKKDMLSRKRKDSESDIAEATKQSKCWNAFDVFLIFRLLREGTNSRTW